MKKTLLIIAKSLLVFVFLVVLYLVSVFALPLIPVQAEATPEPKRVRGFIMTNGVHTDIVVPVKSEYVDWSERFPYQNTKSQNINYKYLAIGWGDKGFYLDTPTWADLKLSTAVEAAFWIGDAAIHATYYETMREGDSVKSFTMSDRQYENLINFIDKSLKRDKQGNYILIKTNAVYGEDDAFYEAKGSYSFLHTCNTWTNNGLKTAGQKAALWTATDFGILRHYKK
ncbi:MAG: TIGR02117 family protein [Cruoricaptor ignavus]|nr:TIGR02117 family protein [Cruoricaptor ignavus]